MRDEFNYFGWLLSQSLEGFFFAPFLLVIAPLFCGTALAGYMQRAKVSKSRGALSGLVLVQIIAYLLVILIGTLGKNSADPSLKAPVFPAADHSLTVLFWLTVAISLYFVWRLKEVRWTAALLSLLLLCILQFAFFVAGMSISGDWL
jgi:hypothetical protein